MIVLKATVMMLNVLPWTRSEDREYFNFGSAELQKEISEILQFGSADFGLFHTHNSKGI